MGEGKILIVDDEKKIVRLVKAYLEKDGYDTLEAYDGAAALELWRREAPDLIVLDILMPEVDGLEFLQEVRRTSMVPVIMLSARSQEMDKLVGLGMGADDYMVKPFSPRELVARIRAVLRRHRMGARSGDTPISEGPLTIYPDRHRVRHAPGPGRYPRPGLHARPVHRAGAGGLLRGVREDGGLPYQEPEEEAGGESERVEFH